MLEVKDLSFSYPHHKEILHQIRFAAKAGQCLAVLGNNGAGKSTMIKCLNRILEPMEGSVLVDGQAMHTLTRKKIVQKMAYVSQQSEKSRCTVYDAVLLGRKPHIQFNPTEKDHTITQNILCRLKLEDYALRNLDELSGGEVQKVMLARALVQEPKVLMLDEPTSNLDLKNQYEVMAMMKDIAYKDKICVIIVIHDLNLAMRYCDLFLLIKNNTVYAMGGIETMNRENIRQVYGMDVTIEKIHGHPTVVPL